MSFQCRVTLYCSVALAVLAGCGSDTAPSQPVVTRDSAGIAIVEFDLSDVGEAGTLSSDPIVSLGVVEGDPAQEFDGVRSALWLSDSSVAVVNGGTNEIRFFDHNGNHLGSVGGTGDGPGEYQGLSHVDRVGQDTILAFDRWLQRVSLLTRNGGLAWTRQLPFEGAARIARLNNGTFIPVSFLVGMPRRPRGVYADTMHVVSYALSDPVPDTLFAVITLEWFSHGDGQPPTPLPWGRMTFIGSDGELVHVVQSDRFELRSYAADGRLVRIVRSSQSRTPVADHAYEQMEAAWLSTRESPGPGVGPALRWAELPRPEYLPEVAALRVEGNGRVWLEKFEPDPTRERTWFGFMNGARDGTLHIPPELRMLDISSGHVVVRRTDDLGVEYVDVYTVADPSRLAAGSGSGR